jgi:hypothetical protein
MPTNHFIGHRQKSLMMAVSTFDSWFLADTPNPLIAAGWRITRLSGFPALEPSRINAFSPAEERTK